MRDKRKSETYFDDYISRKRKRIDSDLEELKICQSEDQTAFVYNTLFLQHMNLLIASFSRGADKAELTELLADACFTVLHADELTYADALTLASMAVMLDNPAAIKPVLEQFDAVYAGDKLLRSLRSYLLTGKADWQGNHRFPNIYGGLDSVLSADSKVGKENALLAYLDRWYDECEDCAWHDTLDNKHNVYYGYWCFAAAALAIILDLDQKRLAENEYFPAL